MSVCQSHCSVWAGHAVQNASACPHVRAANDYSSGTGRKTTADGCTNDSLSISTNNMRKRRRHWYSTRIGSHYSALQEWMVACSLTELTQIRMIRTFLRPTFLSTKNCRSLWTVNVWKRTRFIEVCKHLYPGNSNATTTTATSSVVVVQ
jgi:hypothetical protein